MKTNKEKTAAVTEIIDLAASRVDRAEMLSSAELCLADARSLLKEGDLEHAPGRALDSLAYSVGILSTDYQRALEIATAVSLS